MAWKNRGKGFRHGSALIVTVFGATLLFMSGCKKEEKAEASLPPTVEVTDVIQKDIPVHSDWIASTDGSVNATIRAQVQGYLIQQNYREGDPVRKGQVLFEIDPRPFQAALDQASAALDQARAARNRAKASLEQAMADVAQTEARYVTARANLKRIRPLAEQNAVSQKDLDDAIGAEQSARGCGQCRTGRGRRSPGFSRGRPGFDPCGSGCGGEGPTRPWFYQDHITRCRHCRHREGADR